MENKTVYLYQLSLADGRILLHESEGLFSVNNPDNLEDKTIINSAVLIKIITPEVKSDVVEDVEVIGEVNESSE